MDVNRVSALLSEIERVLENFNYNYWAIEVKKCRILLSSDNLAGKTEILRLYVGLGSLNDIVLYMNDIPLIAENRRLHDMCEELYGELYKY